MIDHTTKLIQAIEDILKGYGSPDFLETLVQAERVVKKSRSERGVSVIDA